MNGELGGQGEIIESNQGPVSNRFSVDKDVCLFCSLRKGLNASLKIFLLQGCERLVGVDLTSKGSSV